MKNIGVLFGGKSVEHEVSVITGMQVIENLDKSKYNVIPVFIDKDGKWYTGKDLMKFENFKENKLSKLTEVVVTPTYGENKLFVHPEKAGLFGKKVVATLDAVFIALHGTNCEDGTIQGLFELMDIPYVSAGVIGSSVGMDKILMKDVFKTHKLPVVDYTWFFRQDWNDNKKAVLDKVENELKYPMFVKPSNLGSSIGISKANNRAELEESIEVAVAYDRKIIVEVGVENPREINCAVMGYDNSVQASLCEEPVGWKDLLTFEDKYVNSNAKGNKTGGRNIPADISEAKTKEIQETAIKSFKAIDCRGNARIDFLMDSEDNIYVNEINTQPGSVGYYLWEPMGINFKDLLSKLIDDAYKVYEEKNKNTYSYDVDLFSKVNFGGGKTGKQ